MHRSCFLRIPPSVSQRNSPSLHYPNSSLCATYWFSSQLALTGHDRLGLYIDTLDHCDAGAQLAGDDEREPSEALFLPAPHHNYSTSTTLLPCVNRDREPLPNKAIPVSLEYT